MGFRGGPGLGPCHRSPCWKARHQEDCWSLAESPDGRIIATGSYDRYLRFWDAATGNEVRPPIEHPNQVLTVAFSPDGRLVGTSCLDWQVRLWEVSTGKLVCAMSSSDYLTDVRFTPDSRFAVIADAAGLQAWDATLAIAFLRCVRRIRTQHRVWTSLRMGIGRWLRVRSLTTQSSILKSSSSPPKANQKKSFSGRSYSPTRESADRRSPICPPPSGSAWQQYRRQQPEFRPP